MLRTRLGHLKRQITGTPSVRPAAGTLTPEMISWAYLLLLGRMPENKGVIDEKLRSCPDLATLRKCLLLSTEYQENNDPIHVPTLTGLEPAMPIDRAESQAQLSAILEHVGLTWQHHGETEPHWSVLTSSSFLQSNIRETEEEFFRTGRASVELLFAALHRNGIDPSGFRSCVEYGCGLGRVTRWLADRFDRVFAYDISAAHLEGAAHHLKRSDIANTTLKHVRGVEDLDVLEPADVIFSVIVLQHNPPPVILKLVRTFLKSLNPGGVAYFQVPTYREGYRFSIDNYMSKDAKVHRDMEMHVLPQRDVFRLAREEGCELIEVLEDGATGLRAREVSNVFLIRKPA